MIPTGAASGRAARAAPGAAGRAPEVGTSRDAPTRPDTSACRRRGAGPVGARIALATSLLLGGCLKRAPEASPALVQAPAEAAAAPSGRVEDGAYVDGRWPLTVPVPGGWTAAVGAADADDRLVLTDPDGDVRVTVAAAAGATDAPRPLSGCAWAFVDRARYRAVKLPAPVVAATCTPEDADAPRVLAYVVSQDGVVYHVEGRIPPGRLRAGKAKLDAVMGGIRFR